MLSAMSLEWPALYCAQRFLWKNNNICETLPFMLSYVSSGNSLLYHTAVAQCTSVIDTQGVKTAPGSFSSCQLAQMQRNSKSDQTCWILQKGLRMLRATTETRQTERRLAVPSVAVVQDREVSVNNGLEVIVFTVHSSLISCRWSARSRWCSTTATSQLSTKPLKPAEGWPNGS